MHNISTNLINLINSVPNGAWTALLASPFLSGALQGIKHWLSIQNEKLMFLIVTVVCFLAAAGYYLLHTPFNSPLIIAAQTAILGFMTQPFYYLFVKPLYKRITQEAGLAAIGAAEVRTAAVPPEGLPISGNVVSTTVQPDPHQAFDQSIQLEDFSK